MTFNQADFEIRCEWGLQGVAALAPIDPVKIVTAVLNQCWPAGTPPTVFGDGQASERIVEILQS